MAWWLFSTGSGLNQRADPLFASDQGVTLEAQNVGFSHDGVLLQRFAGTEQSLAGSGFTGSMEWIGRFATNAGTEEKFAFADNSGTAAMARFSGGAWAPLAITDGANVANLIYTHAATLNNKYFIAYDSSVNRLHVWDPVLNAIRQVGFSGSVPPVTVAATGVAGPMSGTRWYRKRLARYTPTEIVRRSEPSVAVSLTLASQTGWVITRGSILNANETHWELEAADLEEGPWFRIATIFIETLSFTDVSATIDDTNLSDLVGQHIPPPSAKYILSDGNRLLLAGCWETVAAPGETEPKQNRVWYTSVLGTTDTGDDEQIPDTEDQQNFIDIGDAGPITGLAGPLYGDIYVFKANSIWKLIPLEDFTLPFRAVLLTDVIGCLDQRLIASGEAPNGTPAIYFASADTVTRISQGGMQDLSEAISRDLQFANLVPSSSLVAFDPDSHVLYTQTNVGSSAVPGQYFGFNFDIKREHWTGAIIGQGGPGWIMGRTELGSPLILGETGPIVRTATIAHNDQGHERLLFGGSDVDDSTLLLSLGDRLGLDGDHPYDSIIRIRRFATPGHLFSCGAPTVIYRCPTGLTDTVGTLTLSFFRDDGVEMTERHVMRATPQDDPLVQERHTFTGLQMGDAAAIDLRLIMGFTKAFQSAIPPSVDAVLVPVEQKDAYAR